MANSRNTILNIMTPGNLLALGDPDYSDIATCLGIGQEYQVFYFLGIVLEYWSFLYFSTNLQLIHLNICYLFYNGMCRNTPKHYLD